MDRVIFHCDLNAFYASVELLQYPQFRTAPVAVCGDPSARHGIILAKNEAAKAFGVKTAETIWQARRKCPDLILLPAHHDKYRYYSKLAGEVYTRYTDLVEPFGIDESWLDVTGTLHLFGGDPVALANQLRDVMKQELGLTISVGVSFNKVFAKLGSDYKKPDATTVIWREDVPRIVWPLPVTDLLFVGRASARASAPLETWPQPPGTRWSGCWENMGGRSTTTPPGRTAAQSARRGRCRPPSPWATASPSAGTWWGRRSCGQGSISWRSGWPCGCGGTR